MIATLGVEESTCPYPGLRPFHRDEASVFFGREEQVDQLLRKLQERRFVAVVGSSGCGKSSLILAGLIAGLEAGLLGQGRITWRVATMRPGDRPMRNLAEALVQDDALGPVLPAPLLLASLRRGPLGLVESLAGARHDGSPVLAPDENLLVVIDQFEEIFRFRKAAEPWKDRPRDAVADKPIPAEVEEARRKEAVRNEADAFVALILETIRQADAPGGPPLYVVLTMRSDFLGDCALFQGLPEALNDSQFLAPRLSREQRRASIEGPALVAGGRVEPALVTRLLNDMGAAPDQLPLMQHALMRLWIEADKARPRDASGVPQGTIELKQSDYDAMGGIAGALDRQAQLAYDGMDKPSRKIAERMFRLMGERGPDRRDTRRLSRLDEVARVAEATEGQVRAVVDLFRTPDLNFIDLSGDILDITHESVLRQWRLVQRWIGEEADAAETYRQLRIAALRYEQDVNDKGEGDALGPRMLATALAWRDGDRARPEAMRPNAAWSARYGDPEDFRRVVEFIRTSEKETGRQLAKEQRNKRILTGMVLLGGAAIVLGLFVFKLLSQRDDLSQAVDQASQLTAKLAASNGKLLDNDAELKKKNESLATRILTVGALNSLSENAPVRALLLAVEAVRQSQTKSDRVPSSTAEDILRRILMTMGGRPLIGHTGAVNAAVAAPDGRWIATSSSDHTVRLWDLSSLDLVVNAEPVSRLLRDNPRTLVLNHDAPVTGLDLSPDGRWLVTRGEGYPFRLWDLHSGPNFDGPAPEPCPLQGYDEPGLSVAFSPGGRWLLTLGAKSKARLWDLKAAGDVPSSTRLGEDDRSIRGWSFSRDERWFALVTTSGTIEVWELADSGPVARPIPDQRPIVDPVNNICFGDDGRLAVSVLGGHVILLDTAAEKWQLRRIRLRGSPKEVQSDPIVATDVEGRWVVTTRAPVDEGEPTVSEVGRAGPGALNPESTRADSGPRPDPSRGSEASSGNAVLWDLGAKGRDAVPHVLANFPAWLASPEFHVFKGRFLVVRAGDGTVWVWDLGRRRSLYTAIALAGHVGPVQAITYNDDRHQLFTACADNTVRVWDLASSNPAADPVVLRGHDRPVAALALVKKAEGRLLVTGGVAGSVRLWNLRNFPVGLAVEPLVARALDGWNAVMITPRADWMVAASEGLSPRLWDLRRLGDRLPPPLGLRGIKGAISSFIVSPDGRWLGANASSFDGLGAMTGETWLFDLNLADPAAQPVALKGLQGNLASFEVTPDGRWLACTTSFGGRPNSLHSESYLLDLHSPGVAPARLKLDRSPAVAIGGDRWLVVTAEARCRVLDLKSPAPARAPEFDLPGYDGAVLPPLISPDGRWLAIASRRGGIHLWALDPAGAPPRLVVVLPVDRSLIRNYRFDPTSRRLIALDSAGEVRIWSLEKLRPSSYLPEKHLPSPKALAVSPDGRWCAVDGGGDGSHADFRLWDLSADVLAPRPFDFPDPHDPANALPTALSTMAITSDGHRLVALSGPNAATWDLRNLKSPPISFGNHGGSLIRAELSQDRYLAIAALDNCVRIWDLSLAGPRHDPILLRHREASEVKTIVGPNGRQAITAISGYDNIARLWSLDADDMIKVSGLVVGRNLTQGEWNQNLSWRGEYTKTFPDLPVPPDALFQSTGYAP